MPSAARRWQWTEAACYHILNRGHNRETVLANDADRRFFLTKLADFRDRFGLRIYHYCLMSNHFHLLAQLPNPRRCRRAWAPPSVDPTTPKEQLPSKPPSMGHSTTTSPCGR
jgi:hypothetical protein